MTSRFEPNAERILMRCATEISRAPLLALCLAVRLFPLPRLPPSRSIHRRQRRFRGRARDTPGASPSSTRGSLFSGSRSRSLCAELPQRKFGLANLTYLLNLNGDFRKIY
ncbi:hypothetical protein E2562_018170 [Oryza meyeriana var. granulata]|uniref:Uncharacterized protein n=1 Tax=Oryza meyeriana var. granulata TaxID=110450 RepID=A0A6G1C8Y5_9ORYZ|nr:hypothetical protein E2562_018170 [Oryza meyeriana var. granulata]